VRVVDENYARASYVATYRGIDLSLSYNSCYHATETCLDREDMLDGEPFEMTSDDQEIERICRLEIVDHEQAIMKKTNLIQRRERESQGCPSKYAPLKNVSNRHLLPHRPFPVQKT
jgi:hypothetical protein